MRSSVVAVALAALCAGVVSVQAFDESKYPDWSGEWRLGPPTKWDPSKPPGRGQEAPLTPEYQAIFEANLADQAAGGQGTDPTYICIPDGMPRAMNVVFPMEIVITPKTSYIMIEYLSMLRRIYTDDRDWPKDQEPAFMGYSIGRWIDEGGTGRYNLLEVETRNMKGPRTFDPSGIPLHKDNQTVVKERIYLDKTNPDILHDEITTIDHALTRSWTVMKIPARPQTHLDRGSLYGVESARADRQGELHDERGWLPNAREKGPAAAGFAVLQSGAQVTTTSRARKRLFARRGPAADIAGHQDPI